MAMNLFCLARLLLLLSLSCSLWQCSLSAATITHLPVFDGALPFHLETGYVSLDEVTEADLFYYFVESERKPREDPLILWLTGGAGCSSFYAMCREIGPIRFKVAPYDGSLPTLVYNPYTWTKISNIIFLDSPALSGFSFLRNVEDYNGDDIRTSKEIYNFLRKGYISGNPITSTVIDVNSRVPYAHRKGIISDQLFQAIQGRCPGENYKKPTTAPCIEQIKIFRGFMNELMMDNILTPK